MKFARISLALFAAGVVLAGAVQAQDKAVMSHQSISPPSSSTNSILEMKTEPRLAWGSRIQVTGLFVDLIRPRQTWAMLNPAKPARELPKPVPRFLLPVTAPFPISEAAIHAEPDFALLRFNFR
jgi:hypothetical protein